MPGPNETYQLMSKIVGMQQYDGSFPNTPEMLQLLGAKPVAKYTETALASNESIVQEISLRGNSLAKN